MELGLQGKSAIVCGASRGLGYACATALAKEHANLWIVARSEGPLVESAEVIDSLGRGNVTAVVADITTENGRDRICASCDAPDILVNNAGGPPPGDFREWNQADWFSALNANMFSAIDMIRRVIDGMITRRFGRIVNITSVAVKLPQSELGLSNGARSGLTGFVSGIARSHARDGVTINNLLPGFIDTDRMRQVVEAKATAAGSDAEEFAREFFQQLPAGRPGHPDEIGATCAFLCSVPAAYITAQNILVDGGLYPGTM